MKYTETEEQIIRIAELKGWRVEISNGHSDNVKQIGFQKFTEAGQDFWFYADLRNDDYDAFLDEVYKYYESYDPEEETMNWVDEFGHGINGAPHSLRAVLADMDYAEKMLDELYQAFVDLADHAF